MSTIEEHKAANFIWQMKIRNRDEYANKMIDMIKVVISLSAAMLSIIAALGTGGFDDAQLLSVIKVALVLLLISVLAGVAALHNHAEIHQIMIERISELRKNSDSSIDAINAIKFDSVEPRFFYRHSNVTSIFSFCASLVLITFFAMVNM